MFGESPAIRSVHKFGGASLADGAGMRRVGAILAARAAQRPIAVVSAIEGVTAMLDLLARSAAEGEADLTPIRVRHRSVLSQLQLDPEMLNRLFAELATLVVAVRQRGALTAEGRDHVLSFGERASARIVAAHLASSGLRALPIDAYDIGVVSDSNHGRARVLPHSAERIRNALATIDGVPVITGFVAQDSSGKLTTLGRNGSDLTASLIGEAIGAREVSFWKDVGGVLTADPKLVPQARVLRELSYADAAELTAHGASVLHADAVHPLARAHIRGRVVSVHAPDDAGTLVEGDGQATRPLGVACRRGIVLARFGGATSAAELRGKLATALEREPVDLLHVEERDGELFVAAPWSEAFGRAVASLAPRVSLERGFATVAAIGAVDSTRLLERIAAGGIAVRARWCAGTRATLVFAVAEADLARAAGVAHAALFEDSLIGEGSP